MNAHLNNINTHYPNIRPPCHSQHLPHLPHPHLSEMWLEMSQLHIEPIDSIHNLMVLKSVNAQSQYL